MEQIKNDESYLYVSTMEQILATSLISLSNGADKKWRILSPYIGYGADFSHQPYLSEVARKQTENYRSYLHVSAMEQIQKGESYVHVLAME
ncbi:Golgi apyrase [Gossypium arboreum]|uniref:Golgi apyrase n=1 Tax=Gossypium arboreum TaxID=29729 RepID=A0A0B0N6Z4_GOSAR|nr:Golgi apyrase [Gossypium arboreum]